MSSNAASRVKTGTSLVMAVAAIQLSCTVGRRPPSGIGDDPREVGGHVLIDGQTRAGRLHCARGGEASRSQFRGLAHVGAELELSRGHHRHRRLLG